MPKLRVKRDTAIFWNSLPKIGHLQLHRVDTLARTAWSFLCRPHQTPKTIPTTTRIGAADLHDVRHADQDPGRQRQLAAERARTCSAKTGTMNSSMPDGGQDRHDEHDHRVGHRRLDLAAQLDLGLVVLGDRQQHLVEEAADLAGPDHVDHQRREDLAGAWPIAADSDDAGLDVAAHLCEHLGQRPCSRSARRGSTAPAGCYSPELIIVASWRDMTARSFILTRSPKPGILISRFSPLV